MEIVDELMTPGCPNCFVKHLTAALAYMADAHANTVDLSMASESMVFAARAAVNLVEAATGYASHFGFALGLMERAEEAGACEGDTRFVRIVRDIRTGLVTGAVKAPDATKALFGMAYARTVAIAHLVEAKRELPSYGRDVFPATADSIREMVADVLQEYFEVEEPERKGGEEVMACGTKKAAKAACKGGKCAPAKKAACKGGKCKK